MADGAGVEAVPAKAPEAKQTQIKIEQALGMREQRIFSYRIIRLQGQVESFQRSHYWPSMCDMRLATFTPLRPLT